MVIFHSYVNLPEGMVSHHFFFHLLTDGRLGTGKNQAIPRKEVTFVEGTEKRGDFTKMGSEVT